VRRRAAHAWDLGSVGVIGEHGCVDREALGTSKHGRPGANPSIPSSNSDGIVSPARKSRRGRCETRAAAKIAPVGFFFQGSTVLGWIRGKMP
jgi:hypothetical protein